LLGVIVGIALVVSAYLYFGELTSKLGGFLGGAGIIYLGNFIKLANTLY
jgi:hypothetical protein